jgi:NADPH:quinone reductase-like Zn-dependent oxidoreductase
MPIEIRYPRFGAPAEVAAPVRVPREPLAPGEVRIRIEAAPVHIADLKDLRGEPGFGLKPLPAVPGYEGIGTVIETTATAQLAVGARVYLPLACGAFRSELVTRAEGLIRAPRRGDALQLSLVPINLPTAWLLLERVVRLRPGDWVIQNAANSNVGVFLNVVAGHFGVRIANVVRRSAAARELEAVGAAEVFQGARAYEEAREAMGGANAALGVDAIAGAATQHIGDCLREGGTIANYGLLSGEPCHVTPQQLMFRNLRLVGFFMVRHLMSLTPVSRQRLYDRLSRLVTTGVVHSRIAAVYPLEQIGRALEHAARTGEARAGKVILQPEPAEGD